MAKIDRKTQKIFAGSANGDQLAKFGTMKTGVPTYTSDIETLQSGEYVNGWSEGILDDKAPFLEEMNGIQYAFSKQLVYLFQEGIPEYDDGTTYYQKSIVKEPGTYKLYGSLINDNTGRALTDTDSWVLLIDLQDTVQVRVVTETNKSGSRWYRVYDDKWCEQGGTNNAGTVTFTKQFLDTTYTALGGNITAKTATSFRLGTSGDWVAMGYIV